MADEHLRIFIRAKDAASGVFRRLSSRIAGVANSVTALSTGFLALRAGIGDVVKAVRGVIETFAELATRGGEVINVSDAFRRVAGDQEAALVKLRAAAQGLISDYELMVNFNRAVTLGSAENVDQFATLTRTALALGRALGVDASFAVEKLNLGIAKQSRQILDEVGLIVSVEEANRSYAAAIGTTVDALSLAQRREAFRIAVMESARQKLEQLGDTQLTGADAIAQAATELRNLSDAFAELVAQSEGVRSFFEILAEGLALTAKHLPEILRALALGASLAPGLGFLRGGATGASQVGPVQHPFFVPEGPIQRPAEPLHPAFVQAQLAGLPRPGEPSIERLDLFQQELERGLAEDMQLIDSAAEHSEARIAGLVETLANANVGLDEMILKIHQRGITDLDTVNEILRAVGELNRASAEAAQATIEVWTSTMTGLVRTFVSGGRTMEATVAAVFRGIQLAISNSSMSTTGGGNFATALIGIATGLLGGLLAGGSSRQPIPVRVENRVRIDRSDEPEPVTIVQIIHPSGRIEEIVAQTQDLKNRGVVVRLPRAF